MMFVKLQRQLRCQFISPGLYEDLSMLTSLAVADFFIIVNKKQVAVHFVTMFLTVAGTCQAGAQVCTKSKISFVRSKYPAEVNL